MNKIREISVGSGGKERKADRAKERVKDTPVRSRVVVNTSGEPRRGVDTSVRGTGTSLGKDRGTDTYLGIGRGATNTKGSRRGGATHRKATLQEVVEVKANPTRNVFQEVVEVKVNNSKGSKLEAIPHQGTISLV